MSAGDAARAIKLADGAYLIRTQCCRPNSCAPAAGIRCCLSARCVCEWPDQYGRIGYAGAGGRPVPVERHDRAWPIYVFFPVAFLLSLAMCGGIVWFVVSNIVTVITAVLILGAVAGAVAWLRRPRGPKYNITQNFR